MDAYLDPRNAIDDGDYVDVSLKLPRPLIAQLDKGRGTSGRSQRAEIEFRLHQSFQYDGIPGAVQAAINAAVAMNRLPLARVDSAAIDAMPGLSLGAKHEAKTAKAGRGRRTVLHRN